MKARAGRPGTRGLNHVLRELRAVKPGLKIHLVGHSFGGRLVAAAADGPDDQPAVPVNSLSLLQAAFSHNGFAQKFDKKNDGLYRRVVTAGKVTGPIIVTHTQNDRAVGLAYPIASRLAFQTASALGDENDVYGGLGRTRRWPSSRRRRPPGLCGRRSVSVRRGQADPQPDGRRVHHGS